MKYIYLAIIFILTGVLVFTYVKNRQFYQEHNDLYSAIYKKNIENRVEIDHLKNMRNHELFLNGIQLDDYSTVKTERDVSAKLADIVSNDILVMRYSELNCNTCIDSHINLLNIYADSIGRDNIILFTTSSTRKYIEQFKKANNIKFEIYKLDENLDQLLPEIDLPYFFIIGPQSFRVSSAFVPQKETPDITKMYLDKVILKYFKD